MPTCTINTHPNKSNGHPCTPTHTDPSNTHQHIKSVQSTLSHLITTSLPRAMFTHFLVEHGLSQYYLFYWMDLPGGRIRHIIWWIYQTLWPSELKHPSYHRLSMKSQLNVNSSGPKNRMIPKEKYFKIFKVVDSCWTFSTELSDTFRSCFVYGKEQESWKKLYHNRAKKFHLPKEVWP